MASSITRGFGRSGTSSEPRQKGCLAMKDIEKIGIYYEIWVNYNDLTILPHWKSWFMREIIPKWPQDSGSQIVVIYLDEILMIYLRNVFFG